MTVEPMAGRRSLENYTLCDIIPINTFNKKDKVLTKVLPNHGQLEPLSWCAFYFCS